MSSSLISSTSDDVSENSKSIQENQSQNSAVNKSNKTNPWTVNDADLLHRRYHPNYAPSSNKNDIDYIIIGSGIGGLWLAACLSKFGFKCLVLEQHDIAGGFQHSFRRGPYEFVPGLHYLANLPLCRPLYDMVATRTEPPLKFHQSGKAVEADQGCSHELKVGTTLPLLQVKEGLDNVRNELIRVFPQEQRAIDTFLTLMEKVKWQAGQFATFRIFPKPLQWLLSQVLCSSYIHYASLTTDQVLSELTNNGRLKTVLSAFGGDLGESLAEGSFVMQAAVLGHVLEGCYYPESGPLQFVRGLVPTIRQAGGDVLVRARVKQILVEETQHDSQNNNNHNKRNSNIWWWQWHDFVVSKRPRTPPYRAIGVQLSNGHVIHSRRGVVSDAGFRATLHDLLPRSVAQHKQLQPLMQAVQEASGGISHVFTFVGLNASTEALKLRSSSFYYIPWNDNETANQKENNNDMDATDIQEYYRNTLLDPNVLDVSAGMVFCTAKDPVYSAMTMPNRSTVIVFSEARAEDFEQFLLHHPSPGTSKKTLRTKEYKEAKQLIEKKMMRSLLLNFPHLEPFIDFVEVGTPLTIFDYTLRTETLGLRHTPQRMTNLDFRPDCPAAVVQDLYLTGQDVAFSGWAGALAGGMVTAQLLLNYTLLDFVLGKKTLMRDLGYSAVEGMIQQKVQESTEASPWEVLVEIWGNVVRHLTNKKWRVTGKIHQTESTDKMIG